MSGTGHLCTGDEMMKWVTRQRAKVDRIVCANLCIRTKKMIPSQTNNTGLFVASALLAALLSSNAIALGQASGPAMDTGAIERLTGANGVLDEKEGCSRYRFPARICR